MKTSTSVIVVTLKKKIIGDHAKVKSWNVDTNLIRGDQEEGQ